MAICYYERVLSHRFRNIVRLSLKNSKLELCEENIRTLRVMAVQSEVFISHRKVNTFNQGSEKKLTLKKSSEFK